MRLYSSSPPPMEDAEEEEEEEDQDEFGDFGAFSPVSASGSFGEPDAPAGHASFATSPPELLNGLPAAEEARRQANGAAPAGHPPLIRSRDRSDVKRPGSRVAGDGGGEVIGNGFAASDVKPGPRSFVSDRAAGDVDGPEAEFDDFAAFSDTGRHGDAAGRTSPDREATPPPTTCDTHSDAERHAADFVPDRVSGVHTNGQRNSAGERAEGCADANGVRADDVSGDRVDGSDVEVVAGGDGRASDTETETSLGRPLSTDALDDYGDVSTSGSAPSPPPLQEENATPADRSQLDDDDDDDEEFGDFGDPAPARDRFGDSDGPRPDGEGGASFADARWSAFGEESQGESWEGESWAAFSSEDAAAAVEAGHRAQTPTVDRDGGGHAVSGCHGGSLCRRPFYLFFFSARNGRALIQGVVATFCVCRYQPKKTQ